MDATLNFFSSRLQEVQTLVNFVQKNWPKNETVTKVTDIGKYLLKSCTFLYILKNRTILEGIGFYYIITQHSYVSIIALGLGAAFPNESQKAISNLYATIMCPKKKDKPADYDRLNLIQKITFLGKEKIAPYIPRTAFFLAGFFALPVSIQGYSFVLGLHLGSSYGANVNNKKKET